MSGQTLNDRLTAARHALAGQGLARIVCKATTEEVIGPKKKHLDYLLHCTNEPNVSIPQLANLLIERTQNASWVVVFKALITVHNLMCYGNERFTQYLASSNCTFQLGSFLDKVGVQSYDMSTFIRRYAKYLNEKAVSYRTVAFDFCKCKRGKEDGILRQMNTEQLLKTLPALQAQLDSLLEFDCSTNDLCNGVVNSCFMLLFRDLVRLFACYNDGIINLLGKYFEMNKKHARDALDIYKKFLIRMDRVAEFLKVAENIGVDKGDIPDLTKAPSSLLEALEAHLATLEGRKGSTSAASAAARASHLQNAVNALSCTSSAFGSAGEHSPQQQDINGVKTVEDSIRKAVEEEAEIMTQLKFDNDSPLLWEQPAWEDSERRLKEMSSTGDALSPPAGSLKTNPFLSSPADPVPNQKILDLFNTPSEHPATNGSPADDLLGLGGCNNPFADSLFGGPPLQQQQAPQHQQTPQSSEQNTFAGFTNGFGSSDAFASDASFAAAFGDSPGATHQEIPAETTETASTAAEMTAPTSQLSLPTLDPFAGRSVSPSPTTELMKGAGTTPILSHGPLEEFAPEEQQQPPVLARPPSAAEVRDTNVWGGGASTASSTPTTFQAQTVAACDDLFGAPFEMPPPPVVPTAVVTPQPQQQQHHHHHHQIPPPQQVLEADLFGFDSEVSDIGEQQPPLSAQPPVAPPPSPFGGLDMAMAAPDLRAQAFANAVGVALPMQQQQVLPQLHQQPPQSSSGLEDLDFAISAAMQPTLSPVMANLPSGVLPGPRPPYAGQQPFPGGMMQPMAPSGAGSPGYGTPSSGTSSPAKPVVQGFGAPPGMPGAFDAFGDPLQPHQQPLSMKQPEKTSSSILKGDLDSTMASLVSSLAMDGSKGSLKKQSGHQWGSPKTAPVKPPGNWTAPAAVVPMAGANQGWNASPQHGFQQQQQMGQAPPAGGQWSGVMGGAYPQQMGGVFQQQQFMGGGVRPGMGMAPQPQQPMYGGAFSPQVPLVPQAGVPTQANDPFGAL